VLVDGAGGFRDKFLRVARRASAAPGFDAFLKVDADCLVYEGAHLLVDLLLRTPAACCAEGVYFDFPTNRFRIGTPHAYRVSALRALADDPRLMPSTQRPEDAFQSAHASSSGESVVTLHHPTCLHDFEQYPSKICNAVLNRHFRRNAHLFSAAHVAALPEAHRVAVEHARTVAASMGAKPSMDHLDFRFLDEGVPPIEDDEACVEHHRAEYARLLALFPGVGVQGLAPVGAVRPWDVPGAPPGPPPVPRHDGRVTPPARRGGRSA
jgi:hypothetical protein